MKIKNTWLIFIKVGLNALSNRFHILTGKIQEYGFCMSPQVHWSQQSDSKDKSTNPLTRLGDRPIRPKPGLLTDFIQIKKYETGLVKKPRPKNLDLLDIKNDLTFYMHFREDAPRYDAGLTGDSMSFR